MIEDVEIGTRPAGLVNVAGPQCPPGHAVQEG